MFLIEACCSGVSSKRKSTSPPSHSFSSPYSPSGAYVSLVIVPPIIAAITAQISDLTKQIANLNGEAFIVEWGEPFEEAKEESKIVVYVMVEEDGDISYDDDMDAPGKYEVTLPANAVNVASCALDSFHECIPIKNLEEFAIWVEDAAGNTIEETEDAPLSYQSQFRGSVEKVVGGSVDNIFRVDTKGPMDDEVHGLKLK